MSVYQDWILPHLVNLSMRQENLVPYRRRVIGSAEGRVLEIGVGSGLNLPFYRDEVRHVVGVDPSPKLLSMAQQKAVAVGRPIDLIEATAEAIPLEGNSVDTIVTTWTLCTIPDITRAFVEMRRVLTPTGRLLFVEHGRSPDPRVTRWQDRLTPLWKQIGGGCHLNRPIRHLIEAAGFTIEHLETGYMKGPKLMTFMYEGRARPTSRLGSAAAALAPQLAEQPSRVVEMKVEDSSCEDEQLADEWITQRVADGQAFLLRRNDAPVAEHGQLLRDDRLVNRPPAGTAREP